jgi:hypothetical protein
MKRLAIGIGAVTLSVGILTACMQIMYKDRFVPGTTIIWLQHPARIQFRQMQFYLITTISGHLEILLAKTETLSLHAT